MYTAAWRCRIVAPVDWRCPVGITTARRWNGLTLVDVKWDTVRRPTDVRATAQYQGRRYRWMAVPVPTLTARRAARHVMRWCTCDSNWVLYITKTCSSCSWGRRRTAWARDPISAPNVLWDSKLLFVGKVHFVEELFAQVSLIFCLYGSSNLLVCWFYCFPTLFGLCNRP